MAYWLEKFETSIWPSGLWVQVYLSEMSFILLVKKIFNNRHVWTSLSHLAQSRWIRQNFTLLALAYWSFVSSCMIFEAFWPIKKVNSKGLSHFKHLKFMWMMPLYLYSSNNHSCHLGVGIFSFLRTVGTSKILVNPLVKI